MGTGYFEHSIEKPWSIVENKAIGPSDNTSLRPNADLPNTSSSGGSDANTIYLDPFDGNDGNTGFSLALAKKTFDAAFGAIVTGRRTLHIEIDDTATHGTHGTLTETITSDQQNTFAENIQVAEGQTCKLSILSSGGFFDYQDSLSLTGFTVNGLELELDRAGFDGRVWHWCKCSTNAQSFIIDDLSAGATPTKNSIFLKKGTYPSDYSITSYLVALSDAGHTTTLNVANCVFADLANDASDLIRINAANGSTLDLTRLTLYNSRIGFKRFDSATAMPTFSSNSGHIIHQIGELVGYDGVTGGLEMAFTNSLINTNTTGIGVISDSTNLLNKNPLFLDAVNEDFRTMHKGRIAIAGTPNIYYPLFSPALNSTHTTEIMGAYDFTYTKSAEVSQQFDLPIDFGTENYKMAYERANFQKFKNIEGRAFVTHDGSALSIEMFFEGKYWTGEDFSYGLANMFRSQGFKRYYPMGADGIEVSTAWIRTAGLEDGIITSVVHPKSYIFNQFAGWVVRISWDDGGAKSQDAFVLSNAPTKITVLKISGDDGYNLPAATPTDVKLLYIPCFLDMNSLEMPIEMWTENDNQIIQPFYNTSGSNAGNEPHARKLKLLGTIEKE